MSAGLVELQDTNAPAQQRRPLVRGEARVVAPGDASDKGERVAFATLAAAPGSEGALPVVYLHGLGSDLTDLLDVARLVPSPAVLIDLPGFGRSERVDRAFPVARAAAVVDGVLAALGHARAVVCGCSYGGHVAMRLALDAPERVAALALVSSGGLFADPPVHLAALFEERLMAARPAVAVLAAVDALVARPTAATARYRARRVASHVLGAPAMAGFAAAMTGARVAAEALGLEPAVDAPASDYVAVARSARASLTDDAGRRLAAIAAPVELVHTTHDPLVPLEVARAAAGRLRAGLTVLDGHGHMPWLECPGRVAAAVRRATERAVVRAS